MLNQFILIGKVLYTMPIKYCNKDMIQVKLEVDQSTYTIITSLVYEDILENALVTAFKGHIETNGTDVFLIGTRMNIISKKGN